jgi:hypothetical protein
MSVRAACFIIAAFSGKKQNFWLWDCFLQVLDYQEFQII